MLKGIKRDAAMVEDGGGKVRNVKRMPERVFQGFVLGGCG